MKLNYVIRAIETKERIPEDKLIEMIISLDGDFKKYLNVMIYSKGIIYINSDFQDYYLTSLLFDDYKLKYKLK